MKMIFCRIGWMERYDGLEGDSIRGGGAYVDEYEEGFEANNFSNKSGKCYGYVRVKGKGALRIERLGAGKVQDAIDDILVVWVSDHKIVGWYWNAICYRYIQSDEKSKDGNSYSNYGDYHFVALYNDCTLLPVEDRIIRIPRAQELEGFMGQSNVWYVDSTNPEVVKFKKDVLAYISAFESTSGSSSGDKIDESKDDFSGKIDQLKKKEIELISVGVVKQYYGSNLVDVQKENCGWDFSLGNKKIEVKGTSAQKSFSVRLSPNEYNCMKEFPDDYIVAVVTGCLDEPVLKIFEYENHSGNWISNNLILQIYPFTGALLKS